jgi:hypothetical protein
VLTGLVGVGEGVEEVRVDELEDDILVLLLEDEGIELELGVGVGVGVGDDEDEDEIIPPQLPKPGLQPVPQWSDELPHQYHSEQQFPNPEPAQVVTLPHRPLLLIIRVGVGPTLEDVVEEDELLLGVTRVEDDVELDDGVGVGVGVGVDVDDGGGGASPHLPYCG